FLRLLNHYEKTRARPRSKVNVLTLMAGEQQTMNFYKTVGNFYGSPEARQLYAEISNVEEEHVTQYESLMDPTETWLEKWVMHEFTEVANCYTCMETEVDPRISASSTSRARRPSPSCACAWKRPAWSSYARRTRSSRRPRVSTVSGRSTPARLSTQRRWRTASSSPSSATSGRVTTTRSGSS